MSCRKIGLLALCLVGSALLGTIARPDRLIAQRVENPVAPQYTYETVAAAEVQNSPYSYVWIIRTDKNSSKTSIAYCITYDAIAHPDAKQPECSEYKPL